MNWDVVADTISAATGKPFGVQSKEPLGGGCINDAFKLVGEDIEYFVKTNRSSWQEMFIAEAEGLKALAEVGELKVPRVVCDGNDGSRAFLVLEMLSLKSLDATAQELLGKQLARLHRHESDRFGWHRDNTIGSTPQINTYSDEWPQFYAEHRLGFQLDLAGQKGLRLDGGKELCDSIGVYFENYQPVPSLLHGDLWGGNAAMDNAGNPVLFDPACYYGDRETDIAFTEMFGGFNSAFYRAYRSEWPLHDGYEQRKDLYNLYHVLNHYNLFGGGYGMQAQGIAQKLLSQI